MPSLSRSVTSVMLLIFSSQVSVAMINCNHAMNTEDSSVVVAEVCFKDGDNSQMLQCRDGEGYFVEWLLNEECDESHANVVEALASDFGIEAVCDADPCHIAVLEVFDDGSDSSDSGDSSDWGPSNSTYNGTVESESSLNEARRLLDTSSGSSEHSHSHSGSESVSSDSSSCDYSGTADRIETFIVGACQPMSESESILITCTGTHDATVDYFSDDENHECSGTATAEATASAFFGEQCATMVACNVEAGDDYDAAPTVVAFAPLLMALAVLLNA